MSCLQVERHEPLVTLVLDRPERHNALNPSLVGELTAILEELQRDDGVRVLILTGSGDETFSAGVDLEETGAVSDSDLKRFLADTRKLFRILAGLDRPTVAAVNGHAHGGGAELACACDLRIATPRATFRFPGAEYGMAVGTWHLPTLVGLPRAKELLFTAGEVAAEEALRIGLINHLVDPEDLLERARQLGERIAEHPPEAIQAIKSLLHGSVAAPLQQRFFRELYSNQERKVDLRVGIRSEQVRGPRRG